MNLLLDHHRVEQSAIQFEYRDGPGPPTTATAAPRGKKRVLPSDAEPSPVVSKKKPRTCVLCHRADCEGRWKARTVQSLERYAPVAFQPCKSSLTYRARATRTLTTGKSAPETAPLAAIAPAYTSRSIWITA